MDGFTAFFVVVLALASLRSLYLGWLAPEHKSEFMSAWIDRTLGLIGLVICLAFVAIAVGVVH